ncbi:MAG: protein kinase [Chloracidobacterium sp.]|nr:protein kinase [Chloracidobacterium sp.]
MSELTTGTIVADKFRIDSPIRTGELGVFYRGRHLFMDKPVTLKVLPGSLALDEIIRDRFTDEARAATALASPNILAANDFGSDKDGSFYVVYEGFDGEALKNSIGAGIQYPVEHAAALIRQIADAVGTAHENGFIHGNLTPDSVLVSPADGTVKVFDFELAGRAFRRSSDDRANVGVAYLAPENFSGFRAIDARSDIYGLGIILFQMLAGEVPFKGETPTDVMLKHAEEDVPALTEFRKDVPAAMQDLIKKALAKDPDERYQTAAEFVADLDKAVTASGSGTFWKTAVAVVFGTAALALALIYGTSVKQTLPVTQLQPDLNGQPVQPINPATGADELALAAMPIADPSTMTNAEVIGQPPSTLSGGDNYNPWATGAPPPGAPLPTYVPPGGQVYTIDPNTGSPFMPPDGVILVPVPVNTDTGPKPTPSPKQPASNTNAQGSPGNEPPANKKPADDPRPSKPAPEKATPSKPSSDEPETGSDETP